VIEVAAYNSVSMLLTSTGEVWSFGRGPCLGHGERQASRSLPSRIESIRETHIVHIACYRHALALSTSGELYSWGRSDQGQMGHGQGELLLPRGEQLLPRRVEALTGHVVNHVSAGNFSLAVSAVGELWSWGFGANGELGHGDKHLRTVPTRVGAFATVRIVHASAGECHALAADEVGRVYVWGGGLRPTDHPLAHATPRAMNACLNAGIVSPMRSRIVRVECGLFNGLLLSEDGQVFCCGDKADDVVEPLASLPHSMPRVLEIATKFDHSVLRSDSGDLLAFGDGRMGQLLGSGRAVRIRSPSPLSC
jgi:hypothetical protein